MSLREELAWLAHFQLREEEQEKESKDREVAGDVKQQIAASKQRRKR